MELEELEKVPQFKARPLDKKASPSLIFQNHISSFTSNSSSILLCALTLKINEYIAVDIRK